MCGTSESLLRCTGRTPICFVNSKGTGPVCPRTIQVKFESYTKKLGTHISPHTLRHTFAAHLARKVMPLACIRMSSKLRHSFGISSVKLNKSEQVTHYDIKPGL
ncbi:tyrosine-type recombinase/integrase [Cytobacillus sp. FSL W8-0315]|uniref:tyrosine-type recombinase/integrase n=1 Tax=Cytobacillus sp. FSL W8-0315 TaxID=2921600 RepID=UPI00403FFFE2